MAIRRVELSDYQLQWLKNRGGRDESFVEKDKEGYLYIEMYNPFMDMHVERVFLPKP